MLNRFQTRNSQSFQNPDTEVVRSETVRAIVWNEGRSKVVRRQRQHASDSSASYLQVILSFLPSMIAIVVIIFWLVGAQKRQKEKHKQIQQQHLAVVMTATPESMTSGLVNSTVVFTPTPTSTSTFLLTETLEAGEDLEQVIIFTSIQDPTFTPMSTQTPFVQVVRETVIVYVDVVQTVEVTRLEFVEVEVTRMVTPTFTPTPGITFIPTFTPTMTPTPTFTPFVEITKEPTFATTVDITSTMTITSVLEILPITPTPVPASGD